MNTNKLSSMNETQKLRCKWCDRRVTAQVRVEQDETLTLLRGFCQIHGSQSYYELRKVD